jgi:hypothetical protein
MPPQIYKRVDKWTHEPRSILNHKNHVLAAFIRFYNFSYI